VGSNTGATGVLDGIQGALTINGSANDTASPGDSLIFHDQGQTVGQTYTLTNTTLTRSNLTHATITFGTVETLEIDSGSGSDKFVVNFSSYPVSPLMTVKFDGGGQPAANGMDTVQINGTANPDTILVGVFGSAGGEPIQINNIECLQIFGNAGNDVLVNDTNVSSLIDGGDGNDLLVGGDATDVIFGGAGQDQIYGRGGGDYLFADYEFNNRSPIIPAGTGNAIDQVYGDLAPPASLTLAGYPTIHLPSFSAGTAGIDTIVVGPGDIVNAGGQVGDTIIGSGLGQLSVLDWLRARFLQPTSKNIQAAITAALNVPCTKIN